MTTPAERAFAFFPRGQIRDDLLTEWRLGLALLTNPETGALFTQDEIAQATQQGSRWWIEADAIDLVGLAIQSRALYLADQVRVRRASSSWLRSFHGDLWLGEDPLAPSPGGGQVSAVAPGGTIFAGSTTPGDPGAVTYRDQAGLRYQVKESVTVLGGASSATLTLVGIDTGPATNLRAGAILTLDQNPPLGAQSDATVSDDFTGGLGRETDAEYADRIVSAIRHKQGAGNAAQMRAWARQASTAVADAYVYPCAMHAGSVLVALTQKRTATGPERMQPGFAALASVTAYLVPPGSPVMPDGPFVVVTGFTPAPADVVLELALPRGAVASGWGDVTPWPGYSGAPAVVESVTDAQHFAVHSDTGLPPGVTAPQLMTWHLASSRWVRLDVTSVTDLGGGSFAVVLQGLGRLLTVGDWISPDMARRDDLAATVEQYFDGLGPGEVVGASDARIDRAARFPEPGEAAPYRGGQAILTPVLDALGGSLADASLASMSVTVPPVPAETISGPGKLTLGRLAVYDLP